MSGYSLLSKIYRELLEPRGFFTEQHNLLLELCDMYGVRPDARILDAACGTGDVAVRLKQDGYEVFGIDGSHHQLSQWPQAGEGIERACYQWESIASYFKSQSNFDTIYILGHSLPHLSLDKLPPFLKHVHNNLHSSGLFVFDVRQWDRTEKGTLFEANREYGVMKHLTTVHIDGVAVPVPWTQGPLNHAASRSRCSRASIGVM